MAQSRIDALQGPEIHALLQEYLQSLSILSPPESMHALLIHILGAAQGLDNAACSRTSLFAATPP